MARTFDVIQRSGTNISNPYTEGNRVSFSSKWSFADLRGRHDGNNYIASPRTFFLFFRDLNSAKIEPAPPGSESRDKDSGLVSNLEGFPAIFAPYMQTAGGGQSDAQNFVVIQDRRIRINDSLLNNTYEMQAKSSGSKVPLAIAEENVNGTLRKSVQINRSQLESMGASLFDQNASGNQFDFIVDGEPFSIGINDPDSNFFRIVLPEKDKLITFIKPFNDFMEHSSDVLQVLATFRSNINDFMNTLSPDQRSQLLSTITPIHNLKDKILFFTRQLNLTENEAENTFEYSAEDYEAMMTDIEFYIFSTYGGFPDRDDIRRFIQSEPSLSRLGRIIEGHRQ